MMPRGKARFSVECESVTGTALSGQVVAQARVGAKFSGQCGSHITERDRLSKPQFACDLMK
jgi:hypothetical protein